MVDTKVSALTEATSWATSGGLYLVESIEGTPASKYITLDNFVATFASADLVSTSGTDVAFTRNYTVNQASGTAGSTGFLLNQTQTAQGSGTHLLMDLQVGGTSKAKIDQNGRILAADGTSGGLYFFNGGNDNLGWIRSGSNQISLRIASANYWMFNSSTAFEMLSAAYIGWGASLGTGVMDVRLYRDAAATLAQRNSTNAQTFNIYNTYTSGSVYERLQIGFGGTPPESAGGGVWFDHTGATQRDLWFGTVDSGGHSVGLFMSTSNKINFILDNGQNFYTFTASQGLVNQADLAFGWSSSVIESDGTMDTRVQRAAAGIVKITSNGTNPAALKAATVVRTVTVSDDIEVGDEGCIVETNSASDLVLTIQDHATQAMPSADVQGYAATVAIHRRGTGKCTITADTGVTLNGVSAGSCEITGQYGMATIYQYNDDTWTITGDHTAVA